MSNLDPYQTLTVQQRLRRYFSEDFKRQKVFEIEKKLVTIAQVSVEYQVSKPAIHKWLYKYSAMRKKKERLVYESESETIKMKLLQERIKELEQAVGKKQLKIDFLEKMIELAEDEYKVDIKKKSSTGHSTGSKSTGKD